MDWVLIGLNLGVVVYCVKLFVEYLDREKAVLPEIDRVERIGDQVAAEAVTETSLRDEVRGRLPDLRASLGELQANVGTVQEELDAARKLGRRLQMELNREHLKIRRRVAAGY